MKIGPFMALFVLSVMFCSPLSCLSAFCSMDKLYDLMLMGLKYQLVCCKQPEDILQVRAPVGSCVSRWLKIMRMHTSH